PEELAPVLMRGRVGFVRSGNLATVSESYGLEPLQKAPLEIQFAGPAASQVAGHQAVSPVAIAEKVEHIPDPSGKSSKNSLAPQEFSRLVKSGPAETSGERLFGGSDFIEAAEDVLRLAAESPLDPDLRMLSGIALFTA